MHAGQERAKGGAGREWALPVMETESLPPETTPTSETREFNRGIRLGRSSRRWPVSSQCNKRQAREGGRDMNDAIHPAFMSTLDTARREE